jgi:imidazolonepropionase-like amidohydrolase
VVDGSGKFLIPGLWDMHVHFPGPPAEFYQSFLTAPPAAAVATPPIDIDLDGRLFTVSFVAATALSQGGGWGPTFDFRSAEAERSERGRGAKSPRPGRAKV